MLYMTVLNGLNSGIEAKSQRDAEREWSDKVRYKKTSMKRLCI